MSGRVRSSPLRAAFAALLLAAPCLGDGPSDSVWPVIRKVYVPAGAVEKWPGGPWEPLPFSDLERKLAERRGIGVKRIATGLERAEYRAKLAGDTLQEGTFEWTLHRSATSGWFLPLDPLNLSISNMEWLDVDTRKKLAPVIWGSTTSQTAGLLVQPSNALAIGAWSMVGRSLARSTEFEIRLPAATVSHLALQIPDALVPETNVGELTGPKRGSEPGYSTWELHLGSRTSCRLRFSPPIAETARRPLIVARSRTKYDVRPEVVRVLAEFDLDVYETSVHELRVQIDEGLQVVGVEYGDDDEVAWRAVDGSDGRAIVVQLPDSLTGAGQVLRVRGISPGRTLQAWGIPRMYLPDVVESEAQVSVRLQPPYEAADLRSDGYRQIEVVARSDGETVVLRQLKPGASLVVVPSSPRLDATGRSVTLAKLEGEEWTLTSTVELQAMAGSAFEAACQLPDGWEIVNVQNDAEPSSAELAGWDVAKAADGKSELRFDFQTALSPARSHRLRVTARRKSIETGNDFPVPSPVFPAAVAVDEAITVIIGGADRRAVLQESAAWEVSTLADLRPGDQTLDFLRGLSAAARVNAVVLRTNTAEATGTLSLRSLDSPDSENTGGESPRPPTSAVAGEPRSEAVAGPVVVILADVRIALEGADAGFDQFQLDLALGGREGAELKWELPANARSVDVRLNGRSVEPQSIGTFLSLRLPGSSAEHKDRHEVSIDYRVPVSRPFGANRRRLGLPRIQQAILGSRVNVFVPENLRLAGPPGGMDFVSQSAEASSLFGPLARSESETILHPFDASEWRWLRERVEATGIRSARSLDESARGRMAPSDNRRGRFDSGGTIWSGSSQALPVEIELSVWDREQAESLTWATWWLSLLVTVILRIRIFPGSRLAATSAVAVLVGSMWVLPPLYAQMAGSTLVALAIGMLLPQRLLHWRRPFAVTDPLGVPTGSTRSFATASLFCLLAILPLSYTVRAQDERPAATELTTRATQRPRERVNVLIPTGADGRPVSTICYVPADFLSRLNRSQSKLDSPSYLLTSAAFDATVIEGRQVEITARFVANVLSGESSVRIELPLTNVVLGGDDACLVDGRPHPVLLGPGGRGLIVELAGAPPRPEPVALPSPETESASQSSAPKPTSPDGTSDAAPSRDPLQSLVVAHHIELHLHPLVELEANETFLARLGIPSVSDTLVEFKARNESVSLSASSRGGESVQKFLPPPPDPSRVTARLRPTGELQFRWSRNRQAPRIPSIELTANVSALVDVSPALATTTYQVGYRVHAGAVDSLVWKLPRGTTMVSVQSPGMSGYLIESGESDVRRLIVEFATPQTGTILVTAILVQPLSRGVADAELPLLDPGDTSDQIGHTTLGRYQVAFRQPVDFGLSAAPATADLGFKPRGVDDFLKDWPLVGSRPQQAYDLIRAGTLKLMLQDLPAGLAAKTESSGTFSRGRLVWTFHAEIEPAVVPPFQYRLHADPRLRIQSVTVKDGGKDGTNRLLRWSHLNDTLVLFLNDRAVAGQSLEVVASMPVATSQEIELPRVELEGTTTGSKSVTLTHTPDVEIALPDAASGDSANSQTSGARQNRTDAEPRVMKIEIPAGTPQPHVRVTSAAPLTTAEKAIILRRAGDENLLTIGVEYQVHSGRALEFEMELPADLAQRAQIETSLAAQTLRSSVSDERGSLAFYPVEPVTDKFRVLLSIPAGVIAAGDWTVPVVNTPGIAVVSNSLILAREYTADLKAASLPSWAHPLFDGDADISRFNCFRLRTDETVTTIRLNEDHPDEASGSHADVFIEYDERGALLGRYVLWLPERVPERLMFDWPGQAKPLAVFVDERPYPVPEPADGGLSVPLPSGAAASVIVVTWSDEERIPIGSVTTMRPKIPTLRNVTVDAELLTTRIAPRFITLRPDSNSEPDVDIAMARWETGVAALENQSSRQGAAERAWLAEYVQSVARDAMRRAAQAGSSLSPRLQRQIESLSSLTASLKLPKMDESIPLADPFAGILANDGQSKGDERAGTWFNRRIDRSDPANAANSDVAGSSWLFDRLTLRGLLGVLVALVVLLVVWKTAPFWPWLQEREPVAWGVLGLFWWLALKPGAFGIVLIAWGTLAAVRQLRHTSPSSTDQILPTSGF